MNRDSRGVMSRRRRIAGFVAGLVILAFLSFGIARAWDEVADYDWHVHGVPLAGGLAVVAAFYLGSGLGFVLILEQLAAVRIQRRRILAVWARSLLGRYVPGNVLMVAGRVVLGREAGVSGRVSLAASVYEQALALASGAIAGIAFLAFFGDAGQGSFIWLLAAVPLGLVLLHPRLFRSISTWALVRVKREPLAVFLSVRQVTLLFLWYVGLALVLAVGVGLVVRALAGAEAGSVLFVGLGFLLAFVFPSGLGAREGVFALALSQNLPGGVALAVAAGSRLVLTGVELLFIAAAVAAGRSGPRPAWRQEGGLGEPPATGR